MREGDARKVLAREVGGSVRRWRPAAMPEVVVLERDQTSVGKDGIEESYTLALKTEVTRVTRVRYRRSVHHHTDDLLLMEPGETYTVFPTGRERAKGVARSCPERGPF
jgi:hypothetical protein